MFLKNKNTRDDNLVLYFCEKEITLFFLFILSTDLLGEHK